MMPRRRVVGLIAGAVVVVAVAGAGSSLTMGSSLTSGVDERAPGGATALLRDADGTTVGHVTLRGGEDGTIVTARVKDLPAGFHGFHVHAVGDCTPPFTSASGHVNPAEDDHGHHAGDLPPLLAQQDGSARLAFRTDRFQVTDLFDADGSAVIVHAAPDNLAHIPSRYVSTTSGQPGPDDATLATGDAGERYACGVIGR